MIKSFQIVDSSEAGDTLDGQVKVPQFLASWPHTDSTHLRLTYYRNNIFKAYTPMIFLDGFGVNKSPFQVNGTLDGGICARFVVEGDSVAAFAILHCCTAAAVSQGSWSRDWKRSALAWFDKLS